MINHNGKGYKKKNVCMHISEPLCCTAETNDIASQLSEWKFSVMTESLRSHGLYHPWNSSDQNTEVDNLSLFQGIFPTQGSNPALPHCRWILYQLSHRESPRILERVAYLFSSRSSQPRNRTGVSCVAGGFFTNWAIKEAQYMPEAVPNSHHPWACISPYKFPPIL